MNTQEQKKEQNGFSLVEVMVATMVLTIGLLAMAASTGYISAQLRSTTFDTRRTAAKQQVVEQLRAMTYTNLPTVSSPLTTTVGDYTVTAQAVFGTNQAAVRLVTSGPGYRQRAGSMNTVVDTMAFTILRPQS